MNIYDNLNLLPEDLQGWQGNSTLFGTLIQELSPNIIVEVGSWKGQSSINMGKCIKKFNLPTKLYCIDTWLGALEFITTHKHTPERNLLLKNGYPQIYYQFLSNVVHNNLEDVIIPIPNTSFIGYKYLKYNNIHPELIYIDGSHEYEDVMSDVTNFYDILSPGGIIFGDDYHNWGGVKQAINEFTNKENIKFEIIENNFWVIRK